MKENLHFRQSWLKYENNQKHKQQKRTHKISNNLYWGRCGCKKPMRSFMSFVLSKFIVTFHLFSLLCQRRSSCWKYWNWRSYFENPYHYAKIVGKNRITFLVSPWCTLLFSKKEISKFSEVALKYVHYNYLIGSFWSRGGIDLEIPPVPQRRSVNFSTEINFHLWVFSRFLNCTNGTKSRNAQHICLLVKSDNKNTGKKSKVCSNSFFISHLAALRSTLGNWQGSSLTHVK